MHSSSQAYYRAYAVTSSPSRRTEAFSQLGLSPTALSGETVIVTGAGGGIGYEAALCITVQAAFALGFTLEGLKTPLTRVPAGCCILLLSDHI